MFLMNKQVTETIVLNQESPNSEKENYRAPTSPRRSTNLVMLNSLPNSSESLNSTGNNFTPNVHTEGGEKIQRCIQDASPSTSNATSSNVDTTLGTSSPCSIDGSSSLPSTSSPINLQGATALPPKQPNSVVCSAVSNSFGSMTGIIPQQGLLYSLLVENDEPYEKCQSPLRQMDSFLTKSTRVNALTNRSSSGRSSKAPHPDVTDKKESEGYKLLSGNGIMIESYSTRTGEDRIHEVSDSQGNENQGITFHRTKSHTSGTSSHFRQLRRFHAATFESSSEFYSAIKRRLLERQKVITSEAPNGSETQKQPPQNRYSPTLQQNIHSTIGFIKKSPSVFAPVQKTIPVQGGISGQVEFEHSIQPTATTSSNCAIPNSPRSRESGLSESLVDNPVTSHPIPYLKADSPEPRSPQSPKEFIRLATKTASPVQARVTRWLRSVTEFVSISAPLVSTMKSTLESYASYQDSVKREPEDNWISPPKLAMDTWLTLLIKCWHRLLALYMAENELELVAVPDHLSFNERYGSKVVSEIPDLSILGLPWSLLPDVQSFGLDAVRNPSRRPDRRFAKDLIQFLHAIRQANLTAQEFFLLRNVILMTAHEPEAIVSVGLNVLYASRCPQPGSVAELMKTINAKQTHASNSTIDSSQGLQSTPTVSKVVGELVNLADGLGLMSTICPYRMANLFCAHLHASSPQLDNQFLLSMHPRFLAACGKTVNSFTNQS